jgi:hypothetical protein
MVIISKVLRPNGQPTTRTGSQILQRAFALTEWYGCRETFLTVFNTSFQVPVIAVFTKYDQFLRNVQMIWRIMETQMTIYLMRRRGNLKSTT